MRSDFNSEHAKANKSTSGQVGLEETRGVQLGAPEGGPSTADAAEILPTQSLVREILALEPQAAVVLAPAAHCKPSISQN